MRCSRARRRGGTTPRWCRTPTPPRPMANRSSCTKAIPATRNIPKAGCAGSTLAANGLRGIQFSGANGTPGPFNFGTLYNGSTCYNGCSANDTTNPNRLAFLAVPHPPSTGFGYTSYQITPDIKASIQLNYGLNSEESTAALRLSANSIAADNAYLDPAI